MDYCICCGTVIPEGRQVCPGCEERYKNIEDLKRVHLQNLDDSNTVGKKIRYLMENSRGLLMTSDVRVIHDGLTYFIPSINYVEIYSRLPQEVLKAEVDSIVEYTNVESFSMSYLIKAK